MIVITPDDYTISIRVERWTEGFTVVQVDNGTGATINTWKAESYQEAKNIIRLVAS